MSQSLAKALDIIEALGSSESGYNLVELSNTIGFPHSTVHRLLSTLKEKGFVVQESPSGTYYLSGKFLRLQTTIYTKKSLTVAAIPKLNRLAQNAPCAAHLAVLDDDHILYVESRRHNPFLSEYYSPGRTAPVYSTALGKAILAFLPEEHLTSLLSRIDLEPITPHTVGTKEKLREQIAEIAVRGYAFENQESRIGAGCVAAPIFNHTGDVTAAISTFWWFDEKPAEAYTEFAAMVVQCAREISLSLGWHAEK